MGLASKRAEVVRLCPRERVRADSESLVRIYRSLGAEPAQALVENAYGDLDRAVDDMKRLVAAHRVEDLLKRLGRTADVAQGLGLVTLAQVSRDARAALDRRDVTAFGAIWQRLLRVAGQSLGH